MQHAAESRSKSFFRSSPSTAFDQYLQDIQKLPLITDPAEEKRLARLAQKGDELAAERLVTEANGKVGAFALTPGSRDAALLISLPPGAYTAQLSGTNGGTGMGLIEVYEVP